METGEERALLAKRAVRYGLANFFLVAFQWTAVLFLPLYFKAEGISDAKIGTLISVFSLATLVLVFPLGALTDRLPPRPMMLLGAVFIVVFCAVLPGVKGFWPSAFSMLIAGGGFTLSSISLYSLFFKSIGEAGRGAEVSIFTIGGILGGGAASLICGTLSRHFGITWAIFPLSGFSALALAGITAFLPRSRGLAFPILDYGEDLRRPRTWALIALMFVIASHSGFEQAGYTLLQTEVLKLTPETVGRIFMVIAVTMSFSTLWSGRHYDREERPLLMMAAALLVSGVFMAASGWARGALEFLIYRILHTAGDSALSVVPLVLASLIFPRHRAGGAFAFAMTVNTASYFIFANLAGAVGGHWGFDRAFQLSGLILVVAGFLLFALRPRIRKLFRIEET